MNDAERYRREQDLVFQELAADEELQRQMIQKERDAAWKSLEKIFKYTTLWKSRNYTPEKMERMKQRRIDAWLSDDDQNPEA